MADFRCPVHDVVFQAESNVTRPGTKPEWKGCHPDCPKFGTTTSTPATAETSRKIG